MSTKVRIRRPKAERIEEILEAARNEFAAKGYEATTITDIASLVGLVDGAIYRHFKGKRDILEQLISDYYQALITDVETKLPGILGPRNRLRFLIWRHITAFANDSDFCWLVVRQIRPDGPLYESTLHDFNKRYTAFCIHVIEEGVAAGEFHVGTSPSMVRDMVYGAIEHVMWRRMLSGAPPNVEATADTITDMIVRGIEQRRPEASSLEVLTDRLGVAIDRLEKLTGNGSK